MVFTVTNSLSFRFHCYKILSAFTFHASVVLCSCIGQSAALPYRKSKKLVCFYNNCQACFYAVFFGINIRLSLAGRSNHAMFVYGRDTGVGT